MNIQKSAHEVSRQSSSSPDLRPERLSRAVRQCQAWIMPAGSGRLTADGIEFQGREGIKMIVKGSPDGTIVVVSDYPHRHCRSTLTPAGNGKFLEASMKILYKVEKSPNASMRGQELQRTHSRFSENGTVVFTRTEKPRGLGKEVVFAVGRQTRRSYSYKYRVASSHTTQKVL